MVFVSKNASGCAGNISYGGGWLFNVSMGLLVQQCVYSTDIQCAIDILHAQNQPGQP